MAQPLAGSGQSRHDRKGGHGPVGPVERTGVDHGVEVATHDKWGQSGNGPRQLGYQVGDGVGTRGEPGACHPLGDERASRPVLGRPGQPGHPASRSARRGRELVELVE